MRLITAIQRLTSFSNIGILSNKRLLSMKDIITGFNDKLRPADTATRAETAAMFQRYCELTEK